MMDSIAVTQRTPSIFTTGRCFALLDFVGDYGGPMDEGQEPSPRPIRPAEAAARSPFRTRESQ
jgi:hypothetical protein